MTKTEYLLAKLSQMDPEDVLEFASSEAGASELAELPLPAATDRGSLPRPWASVGRASPEPLTDADYERFLAGKDPHRED